MNGWTTERRIRQAQLIKQWQPWKHSTGARTIAGKAISARNAYKGGERVRIKVIKQFLRDAGQILQNIQ